MHGQVSNQHSFFAAPEPAMSRHFVEVASVLEDLVLRLGKTGREETA